MKKLLLSLLVSFCGLVSFGFCAIVPDTNYQNISRYQTFKNQFPDYDSFLCILNTELRQYNFYDFYITDVSHNSNILSVNGNNFKFNGNGGEYTCGLVPSGANNLMVGWYESNNSLSSIYLYQFLVGSSCEGSDLKINFIDSYNNNTSALSFNLDDGDNFSYNIYYNSYNTPIAVNPSSSVVNLASRYDNIQCESHVSFSDISNGTGVKFLNSLFSPFSGANNVSVYYDSQENVVQVDNQYGVAEVVSSVPSTPCDCSEAISGAVSSCNSQLNTLSGNYNSCLGELDSCMAGGYNTGDLTWSALYINQIQHLGKPIIRINIPEEISRDYSNTGDSFDLDINGYNVDTEYMDNIIKIQNYQPTTEDFTKLVGLFGKYGGLLVSCLLVIIIFALIRKLFK